MEYENGLARLETLTEEGGRMKKNLNVWDLRLQQEEKSTLEVSIQRDDAFITYERKMNELIEAQKDRISDLERLIDEKENELNKLDADEQHYREMKHIAQQDVAASSGFISHTAYEDALNGFNNNHKERRKLQDNAEFQLEDWETELAERADKQLEGIMRNAD